jgi:hypothetical protein
MTTQQWAELAILVLGLLGGALSTWLQRRGKLHEARLLEAVIRGVEQALPSKGGQVPAGVTVKGAIAAVSAELGLGEDLRERVKRITEPPFEITTKAKPDSEPPQA